MYDILQLNDMLVPELLDIAEQLKIPNAKKLNKQDHIYKVLDKQAVSSNDSKAAPDDKGKRKRIIKTTTANSTEEAIVESGDTQKEVKKEAPRKRAQENKPVETKQAEAKQPEARPVVKAAPVKAAPPKKGRKNHEP